MILYGNMIYSGNKNKAPNKSKAFKIY